jgi:hypothetical protein
MIKILYNASILINLTSVTYTVNLRFCEAKLNMMAISFSVMINLIGILITFYKIDIK